MFEYMKGMLNDIYKWIKRKRYIVIMDEDDDYFGDNRALINAK